MHDIIFSIFSTFLISSGVSLFTKRSETIYCGEKYCNYPLTTTQGVRLASCENIVSRSQTSSLPPRQVVIYLTSIKIVVVVKKLVYIL